MAARLSIVSLGSAFRANNYALSRASIVGGRRGIQGSSHQDQAASTVDKVKHGANEAMKSGENIKNTAASTAQNISEKAKETMEKAKDAVMGKTADTKEAVKSQAAKVQKCMNTKKDVS